LQNVDQSGFVYKYQWIELTDTVAGTWDVTGGQFCPHQAVDTDGTQYHLGKLHHLPLGNTTSRVIFASVAPPTLSNYSAAQTAAGVVGIPTGAKAFRAKILLDGYPTGAGSFVLEVNFTDNNSNTPSAASAHPMVMIQAKAVAAGDFYGSASEIDIPINSSGQFYYYTSLATNATPANSLLTCVAVGYYMGD
jgi:hypothetical protein